MFEKLETSLLANNARFREIHHSSEGQSEKVAAVRGTEVGQGAKAMLCRAKEDENILVLAVLPGDRKLDFKKPGQAISCKKNYTCCTCKGQSKLAGYVKKTFPFNNFLPKMKILVLRRICYVTNDCVLTSRHVLFTR